MSKNKTLAGFHKSSHSFQNLGGMGQKQRMIQAVDPSYDIS